MQILPHIVCINKPAQIEIVALRYVIIVFLPIVREVCYSSYTGVYTFTLNSSLTRRGSKGAMCMLLYIKTWLSMTNTHVAHGDYSVLNQKHDQHAIVTYDDNTGNDFRAANQVKDRIAPGYFSVSCDR